MEGSQSWDTSEACTGSIESRATDSSNREFAFGSLSFFPDLSSWTSPPTNQPSWTIRQSSSGSHYKCVDCKSCHTDCSQRLLEFHITPYSYIIITRANDITIYTTWELSRKCGDFTAAYAASKFQWPNWLLYNLRNLLRAIVFAVSTSCWNVPSKGMNTVFCCITAPTSQNTWPLKSSPSHPSRLDSKCSYVISLWGFTKRMLLSRADAHYSWLQFPCKITGSVEGVNVNTGATTSKENHSILKC